MVDEPLARIAVFDEKLVPMDIELRRLFEASNHLIHGRLEEFLTEILSSVEEKGKRAGIPAPFGGKTQEKIGHGMKTTTEQETNSDGKSLTRT